MLNQPSDQPRLFGINQSNRDFHKKSSWGKNQFNSSFPAALACYMSYKNINPVYIILDNKFKIAHHQITFPEIFGIEYNAPHLFFAFERDYIPYQDIVIGTLPRIDLVTIDQSNNNNCLRGVEIKLTALPDHTTCELNDYQYGCEIVVRPPTIIYLAVSIAKNYQNHRDQLKSYLENVCDQIEDWTDASEVINFIPTMIQLLNNILSLSINLQIPLIMQPIWKTEGKSAKLHYDCLDIFM